MNSDRHGTLSSDDAGDGSRDVPVLSGEEARGGSQRVLTSEALFAGRQEIEIRHQGESYRLRITRNGKLILHK